MTYHPPVSIDEIKYRLKREHGDRITIDESSYTNVTTKARFVDQDYGGWWALPNLVTRKNDSRGHPLRGNANIATAKRYDVVEKLKIVHLGKVILVESTYVDMQTKAKFIHVQYGEWWASPGSVITNGTSHPENKKVSKKRLPIEVFKKRLYDTHLDKIRLDDSTYCDSRTKARFIDTKYGEWWGTPFKVACGACHPKQLCHIKSDSIIHWKSNELLTWRGSYEKAFIECVIDSNMILIGRLNLLRRY